MEGLGFFIFLSICVGGGVISSMQRQRNKLELLRASIEKGLPLDPAMIDRLLPDQIKNIPPTPEQVITGLRIGGIMCLAIAVGLPILGYFLRSVDAIAFPALLGCGALLACISIGLFVAGQLVASKNKEANHKT
jgi:hypothetical protein